MTDLDQRIAALEALERENTIWPQATANNYTRQFSDAMSVIRELKAERDASIGVMRELVIALDGAFISSWQSTAAWKKQLDAAIDFLKEKL